MQKPETWKLVLAHLAPTKTDPSSSDWRAYINRYIVPEVRQESTRFFGSTDCIESQNPGLDYASRSHRLRLRSFPHHNQLFAIFDKLQLTENEIYALCRWYGTKRAKEEFERKHHFKITDTTWDGVEPYRYTEPTVTLYQSHGAERTSRSVDGYGQTYEDEEKNMGYFEEVEEEEAEEGGELSGDESEDELQQSVGVELNERLMASAEANAEARARGETVTMDPEWEQWLKEAAERGVAPGVPPRPNHTTVQWGREIPRVSGENAQPERSTVLQARPSPLSEYHPQIRHSASGVQSLIRPPDLSQSSATTSGPAVEG